MPGTMLRKPGNYFYLALMVLALTCTACSTAEQQRAAPSPVDARGLPVLTDEQKDAGIICVREPVIGSRISRKSCTTKEQRELKQRLAREDLEKTQRGAKGAINVQ